MSFPKRPSCVLEKEIIHTALSMLSREAWRNSNFVLARNSLTKERGKCAVLLEKPIFVQMSVLNQNIVQMSVLNQNIVQMSVLNQNIVQMSVLNQNIVQMSVLNQNIVQMSVLNQNIVQMSVLNQNIVQMSVLNQNIVQMSVLNQNIPNMLPASFREQMPSLDKCFHLFCPSTEIPNFCYLQQISHRKKETRWNLKRFTHMHRSGVVQKIQQLTFWSRNFTFKF